MSVVALTLTILWILSLWLLVVERRRPAGSVLLQPLALMSGTLLFFILSLAALLFLRLLLAD
ncbi:MAG: hypothetical protein HYZ72_10685 [Deltaproteobacteria bacterium]|nr:hypothetical protein [Deltaproteobacteria bacterium]